jgi:hypothetical protein
MRTDLYKTENMLEDGERSAVTLANDNMEYLLHHAHGGRGYSFPSNERTDLFTHFPLSSQLFTLLLL